MPRRSRITLPSSNPLGNARRRQRIVSADEVRAQQRAVDAQQRRAFEGSEIDLQQRSFQRFEEQRVQNRQQNSLNAIRDQLLNPPLTTEGASAGIADAAVGRGSDTVIGRDTTAEDLTGQGFVSRVQQGFGGLQNAVLPGAGPQLSDSRRQSLLDAKEPFDQAEALRAAADAAAIGERMHTATPNQRRSMQEQYLRKWGKYAARGVMPVAMTSKQAAELKKEIRTKTINMSAKTILDGGMPDNLLFEDDKGNMRIPDGLRDVMRIREERTRSVAKAEADKFKADASLRDNRRKSQNAILDNQMKQVDLEEGNLLQPGEEASPEETQQFNDRLNLFNRRRNEILNQKNQLLQQGFPEEQQQQQTQTPPPQAPVAPGSEQFSQVREAANREGLPLVADADDFEALESGETFIDPQGNKRTKP